MPVLLLLTHILQHEDVSSHTCHVSKGIFVWVFIFRTSNRSLFLFYLASVFFLNIFSFLFPEHRNVIAQLSLFVFIPGFGYLILHWDLFLHLFPIHRAKQNGKKRMAATSHTSSILPNLEKYYFWCSKRKKGPKQDSKYSLQKEDKQNPNTSHYKKSHNSLPQTSITHIWGY